MRIAICDDEVKDRELLSNFVLSIDSSLSVDLYSSALDLLNSAENIFYEIILMDIEMNPPNGYDVAAKLMQKKDKPLIIFITKSNDYTIRGYGIAFRYIRKPINFQHFKDVFCCALNEVVPQKLTIFSNCKLMVLSIKDIVYFEIYGHELNVHALDATYSYRGALSDVIKTFSGTHFAQPHKSYFVNLAYVYRIESKDIIMAGGDIIPLSILRKDCFIKQLNSFLRG